MLCVRDIYNNNTDSIIELSNDPDLLAFTQIKLLNLQRYLITNIIYPL